MPPPCSHLVCPCSHLVHTLFVACLWRVCGMFVAIHTSDPAQLGELMCSAHASLSTLRVNDCKGVGDVVSWLGSGGFRPLSLIELHKVGALFDNDSMKFLLENAMHLKELSVSGGTGMTGMLCAEQNSNEAGHFASPAIASASSELGTGAMDESGHLGVRGIQRALHEFVNEAVPGQEYNFPPTLSGHQRRLVHEVAESLDLAHESVTLREGSYKIVKVRRKRRSETLLFNNEIGGAVGGEGMWDAPQPAPGTMEGSWEAPPSPPPAPVRSSSVNFELREEEEGEQEEDEEALFKLDEEEEEVPTRKLTRKEKKKRANSFSSSVKQDAGNDSSGGDEYSAVLQVSWGPSEPCCKENGRAFLPLILGACSEQDPKSS